MSPNIVHDMLYVSADNVIEIVGKQQP